MGGRRLGDGSNQWLVMMLVLWAAAACVISYPMLRRVRLPGRGRRAVTVSDVRQDYMVF